jgi:hypothetical protein
MDNLGHLTPLRAAQQAPLNKQVWSLEQLADYFLNKKAMVDLMRGSESEIFPGSMVEFLGNDIEIFLGEGGEIGTFGKCWRKRPLVFCRRPRCHGL